MKNEDKLPSIEVCQERLHDLDEFSYGELTDLLDDMPYVKGGKSRIRQMENIKKSRFMWEKTGHGRNTKYIILEVYDNPIPIETQNTYKSFIKILLMSYLKTIEGHTKTMPASMWFAQLGMYNNSYLTYRKNPDLLYKEMSTLKGIGSERENMFNVNRYHFDRYLGEYYHQVLRDALDDLQDESILNYYPQIMIYDGTQVNEKVDESFGGYWHTVPYKRVAEVDEEARILDVEKSVLEELLKDEKLKTYRWLKLKKPKLVKTYEKMCDEKFREIFEYDNPDAMYTREIKIVFSDTYLDLQIEREMVNFQRAGLNDKLFSWSAKKAQSYLEYMKRNSQYYMDALRYYSLPVQQELADKCIKITH